RGVAVQPHRLHHGAAVLHRRGEHVLLRDLDPGAAHVQRHAHVAPTEVLEESSSWSQGSPAASSAVTPPVTSATMSPGSRVNITKPASRPRSMPSVVLMWSQSAPKPRSHPASTRPKTASSMTERA